MNKTATQTASYDDLLDLPDNIVEEIIAVELTTQPRPSPKHALAASALGSAVFSGFDRSSPDGLGDWWILDKPECHLADDVIVPYISDWHQSTAPEQSSSPKRGISPLASLTPLARALPSRFHFDRIYHAQTPFNTPTTVKPLSRTPNPIRIKFVKST